MRMFVAISLFGALLLGAVHVLAQKTQAELNQALENHKRERGVYENARAQAGRDMEIYQKQLNDLDSSITEWNRKIAETTKWLNGVSDPGTGVAQKGKAEEYGRYLDRLAVLRDQLNDFNKRLSGDRQKFQAATDKFNAANRNIQKVNDLDVTAQNTFKAADDAEKQRQENARKANEERLKGLEDQMAGMYIAFKFSDYQFKQSTVAEKLTAAEHAIDKGVLASYFQKKLEAVMNSESICDSANQCKTKKSPSGVKLNWLFNSGAGTAGNNAAAGSK